MIESEMLESIFNDSGINMRQYSEMNNWEYLTAKRTFNLFQWVTFIYDRLDGGVAKIKIHENSIHNYQIYEMLFNDHKTFTENISSIKDIMFKKVMSIMWHFEPNPNRWSFEIVVLNKEKEYE